MDRKLDYCPICGKKLESKNVRTKNGVEVRYSCPHCKAKMPSLVEKDGVVPFDEEIKGEYLLMTVSVYDDLHNMLKRECRSYRNENGRVLLVEEEAPLCRFGSFKVENNWITVDSESQLLEDQPLEFYRLYKSSGFSDSYAPFIEYIVIRFEKAIVDDITMNYIFEK